MTRHGLKCCSVVAVAGIALVSLGVLGLATPQINAGIGIIAILILFGLNIAEMGDHGTGER